MVAKQNFWKKKHVFNLFNVFYSFEWQNIFFLLQIPKQNIIQSLKMKITDK